MPQFSEWILATEGTRLGPPEVICTNGARLGFAWRSGEVCLDLDLSREEVRAIIERHSPGGYKHLTTCRTPGEMVEALNSLAKEPLSDMAVGAIVGMYRQRLAERVRRERKYAHDTFNGGHHEKATNEAFHHGMDTAFNLLDALLAKPEPKDA